MRKPKIIVAGIGTGGHYFPALVVAQELVRRKVEIIFLVRTDYAEEEIARLNNLNTFAIKPQGFYGRSFRGKISAVFSVLASLYRLHALTKDVVGISFGGFGALPLIISCMINRCSFYLFEPNRIPGRVTKRFASRAKKVFLGLPSVTNLRARSMVTGIPIRKEFKNFVQKPIRSSTSQKRLLFYGGSQGAQRLNRLAIELQGLLPSEIQIVIMSGKRDYEWVNSKRNGRTTVLPFTHEPWQEIQQADLIISRSGALAGYEILAQNKPVIFIPFPYAIDNHQYHNAEYFSKTGNAIVLEERNVTKEILVTWIKKMLGHQASSKSEIILDAERKIVDVILKELK